MSGPGKGADRGAWTDALEALERGAPPAWFVTRASAGRSAAKGVAAALSTDAGAPIRALLEALVGEPAPIDKLLRRAAGREAAARVRKNPIARNEGFSCAHCGHDVPPAPGSAVRNHCPRCLRSLHVDGDVPGDRAADCGGLMAPVEAVQRDGGWRLRQRCERCGAERWNRLHPDWGVDPDRLDALPP
jgi:hypothetical protein